MEGSITPEMMESFLLDFNFFIDDPVLRYRKGHKDGYREPVGQLKLVIGLIDLLTYVVRESKSDSNLKIYMAYVGISPAHYLGLILGLFPQLRVEAWDPRPLEIRYNETIDPVTRKFGPVSTSKLSFHKQYFKDDDVSKLKTAIDEHRRNGFITVFVSDIRDDIRFGTDSYSRVKAERKIIEDMKQQLEWAVKVDADHTQLKFRPPYPIIRHDNGTYDTFPDVVYPPGKVTKQVFTSKLSTETRLVIKREDLEKRMTYDGRLYEMQCFFHNVKIREYEFDPRNFRGLQTTERFRKFVEAHPYSYDAYWTMKIIQIYLYKARKMKYSEISQQVERLILDTILRLTLPDKDFKTLGEGPLALP